MTKTTSRTAAAAAALQLARQPLTESLVTSLAQEFSARDFYDAIEASHPSAIMFEDLDNILDFNEGYAVFNVYLGGEALTMTFFDGVYESY